MIYNYIVEIDRKKTFNLKSDINELIQYIHVSYWSNVLRSQLAAERNIQNSLMYFFTVFSQLFSNQTLWTLGNLSTMIVLNITY